MSEKRLEYNLREKVKQLGGLALKFSSSTYTALPDRIVLMPGGSVCWVELKSEGEEQTPLQRKASRDLQKLGQRVEVIDTTEKLNAFIESLK